MDISAFLNPFLGVIVVVILTSVILKNRFYFDTKEEKIKRRYGCSIIFTFLPPFMWFAIIEYVCLMINVSGLTEPEKANWEVFVCLLGMPVFVIIMIWREAMIYFDLVSAVKVAEKSGKEMDEEFRIFSDEWEILTLTGEEYDDYFLNLYL